WNGFGISAPAWAVVMIAVASVVGVLMAVTRRDAAYLFVLVWSFIGIAVKQADTASVAASAWVGAGVMLAMAIYSLSRRRTA
ncbi:MAG: tryptophan-rich sensory protein, partial [Anaerolineales bacterium]|nr:tryptophan-rich sensory protein [Anaerolineales bacterium]